MAMAIAVPRYWRQLKLIGIYMLCNKQHKHASLQGGCKRYEIMHLDEIESCECEPCMHVFVSGQAGPLITWEFLVLKWGMKLRVRKVTIQVVVVVICVGVELTSDKVVA